MTIKAVDREVKLAVLKPLNTKILQVIADITDLGRFSDPIDVLALSPIRIVVFNRSDGALIVLFVLFRTGICSGDKFSRNRKRFLVMVIFLLIITTL